MSRTTNGVSFFLKHPKADKSPIRVVYCFNNSQLVYYERKLSVVTKHWNKTSQRVKANRFYPDHVTLNFTIDKIQNDIIDCHREFKLQFEREPGLEELKSQVKKRRLGNEAAGPDKQVTVLSFFASVILNAKQGKHLNSFGLPVAETTIRSYEQTFKILTEYSRIRKKVLLFEDMEYQFYTDFVYYLTQECISKTESSYSVNSAGKHITNIKAILSLAIKHKVSTNISFSKQLKVIRQETDEVYLSDNELKIFLDFDLSQNTRLEKVRDAFVLGCCLGLRFSDFKTIDSKNIIKEGNDYKIKKVMQKTGGTVTIPIFPLAGQLIKKNIKKYGCCFPKTISEQKFRKYIQEAAAKLPEFNKEYQRREIVGGKITEVAYPKFELITTHTMRRSFATNLILQGIPTYYIMSLTGHKSEKSFSRYIRSKDLDLSNLMKQSYSIELTELLDAHFQ